MKKFAISIFFVLVVLGVSNIFGQRVPAGAGTPAGGGDKNLAGDDIKTRQIEMERMKQQAQQAEAASFAPINKDISVRFPQIKEDFEGIQITEAAIIKAYTTGKTIDYNLIATSAESINKKCRRLDSNLFAIQDTKDDKLTKGTDIEKVSKTKPIRDLIIDLDNAIGSFVSSKIFGNIKVIEPEVAIKTRTDLLSILDLSEKLAIAAKAEK